MRKLIGAGSTALQSLALGSVVAATVAGTAMAADLRPRAPVLKAPPAPLAYDWSGFYIGAHAGAAWSDNTLTDQDGFANAGVFGYKTDFDKTGGIFGGQVGYNWQAGPFVLGFEGDMSYVTPKSAGIIDPTELDETAHTKYEWVATIRGRLGVTVDRALIYATGGIAFSRIHNNVIDFDGANLENFDPDDSFSATQMRTGWVVGGGIEYGFAPNWTLRAEGLYMDFGSRNYVVDTTVPTPGAGPQGGPRPPTDSIYTVKNTLAVARIGLNYKFGGPGSGY